jgi:hypothetical protein
MIVLRTPKGWTCPTEIDGKLCEGYWRSHQVPMGDMDKPSHIEVLEEWLRSYRPQELFDEAGRLVPDLRELAPKGERRMSANPHANGGLKLKDLRLPDFRKYGVDVKKPGATMAESTRVQGKFLRDVMKLNLDHQNFRVFSPDENNSNRWQDILEVTDRAWMAEIRPEDDHLSPDGRVMEVLSEHQCQGWLEGYLLTGRHGFLSCYEAFIPHHRLDVQPARQMVEGVQSHPVETADRLAQLPVELPRLAPGSQRLQSPGSGLHRSRDQQEGGGDPGLPATRREHAPVGDGPLPQEPRLRERGRGREAARPAVAHDGSGDQALHGRHRHLGVGQQRPGERAGCRHGMLR